MPNPGSHSRQCSSSKYSSSCEEKGVENEIHYCASYSWFCCNCGEGPSDAEINELCSNCQHLKCGNCLFGEERYRNPDYLSSRRRLLGSHLDEFFKIPRLAGDRDEDDGDMLPGVLVVGATQPNFGKCRRAAASGLRSEVDYMIVAERGLGLGAGVLLDEPDYDYVFEAASDWNYSMPAADMNSLPPLIALEQAARWRYGKIKLKTDPFVKSLQNECESYATQLQDPDDFPLVWHHAILPSLVQKLKTDHIREQIGTDFTVVVLRGKTPQKRKISIMTEKPASITLQSTISEYTLALFPTQFRSTLTLASFSYRTGSVSRTNSVRGTSPSHLDDICEPLNRFWYREPRMGDSVGIALGLGDDESTSTLGPCLSIRNRDFWLLNFHPFAIAHEEMHLISDRITLEHPSPNDRVPCVNAGHRTLCQYSKVDFTLGDLMLHLNSGPAYKTTRMSNEPYWQDSMLHTEEVVTDWTLCFASGPRVNILRTPAGTENCDERPITQASHINPGATIRSTGRTSGLQFGQIGLCPAFVTGGRNGNGTGRDTYEWFIEQPPPDDDDERWIKGGIGISGDSGAGVVDYGTNALYGHIWGRNKYWGEGERVTYFTPILDVFNDIQEKFPLVSQSLMLLPCTIRSQERPRLRHCDKNFGIIPSWPLCLACVQSLQHTASLSPSNTSDLGVKGSPVASEQATLGESDVLTPVESISTILHSDENPFGDDSYASLPSPVGHSLNLFEGIHDMQGVGDNYSNGEATYTQDILNDEVFAEDYQLFRSNARRQKRKLSVPDIFVRKKDKISN